MSFNTELLRRLGNVFERIEENFTSEKLFQAADLPLYTGIGLLLEHTRLIEDVFATYFAYPSRKYLHMNRDMDKVCELYYAIYSESGPDRVAHVKALRFNRELLALPMFLVASHLQPYLDAISQGSPDAQDIARILQFHETDTDVTHILLRIEGEHRRFLLMRESILQKYYRMLVKEVRKEGPFRAYMAEDLALEYYCALLRSFARFDITSGTYGSYVTRWFKNAKLIARETQEIGIAFTIPNTVRVKIARGEMDLVNYAVAEENANLDDLKTTDSHDVEGFDTDVLNQIVATYDKTGLYRMMNDLEFDPRYLLKQKPH